MAFGPSMWPAMIGRRSRGSAAGCWKMATGDWPEEPWLSRWLLENGNGVKISRQQLTAGELEEPLQELLAQSAKPPVTPTGIVEAADGLEPLDQ